MALSRVLQAPWLTPGRRLGAGATLSLLAHLGCLALLTLVVTRGGTSPADGDGTEGDRVDVDTIGDPGPQGSADREAGQTPSPGRETRPRRVAVAPTRPRAVTGTAPRPAPAPARPAGRTLATTDPGSLAPERAVLPAKAGSSGPSAMSLFRAELKRNMRAAWRAREVYERIDPQGHMQGSLLVTKLNVRVRQNGTVEHAAMHASSGITALDTEATSAIARMKPLTRLPDELVDDKGGLLVRCAFHLDLGLFRFANQLHHTIAELWRPGRAFQVSGDRERVNVVQLLLNRNGSLVEAKVVQSAGIDFLDKNAVAWTTPGMLLPAPPPNFMRSSPRVPIYVAFAHVSGRLIVKDPEEDLETE
jgi:outer membrane biosynthesis protein TonB